MKRTFGVLASVLVSLCMLAVASPAEAASISKVDKKFTSLVTYKANPDYRLYRKWSTKRLHNLGVAVCGLIKAYDKSEPADDAIIDTLLYMNDTTEYPYTTKGNASIVVASIHSYCTKYERALNSL